jgi:hypothetical protein
VPATFPRPAVFAQGGTAMSDPSARLEPQPDHVIPSAMWAFEVHTFHEVRGWESLRLTLRADPRTRYGHVMYSWTRYQMVSPFHVYFTFRGSAERLAAARPIQMHDFSNDGTVHLVADPTTAGQQQHMVLEQLRLSWRARGPEDAGSRE